MVGLLVAFNKIMSVLSQEIRALLQKVSSHPDGSITAEIAFPRPSPASKGHFPNKPDRARRLPGFVRAGAAGSGAENGRLNCRRLFWRNFRVPVTCREKIKISLSLETTGDSAGGVTALFVPRKRKAPKSNSGVNYA